MDTSLEQAIAEFWEEEKNDPKAGAKHKPSGDPTENAIIEILGHDGKKGAPPPRETENTEYMEEVDALRTEWAELKAEIMAHAKKYAKR